LKDFQPSEASSISNSKIGESIEKRYSYLNENGELQYIDSQEASMIKDTEGTP